MAEAEIKTSVDGAQDAIEDVAVNDAILNELASLPLIEYDRRRQAEAERLGVRVSTLDAEVEKRRRVHGGATTVPVKRFFSGKSSRGPLPSTAPPF